MYGCVPPVCVCVCVCVCVGWWVGGWVWVGVSAACWIHHVRQPLSHVSRAVWCVCVCACVCAFLFLLVNCCEARKARMNA